MAIVIEEGERRSGIGATIAWVSALIVIGLIVYYVFFERPEFIELIPPAGLRDTTQLSKVKLNVDEVIQNPQFTSLRQYISLPPIENVGRQNPFLAL